jgi:hypothetical protein
MASAAANGLSCGSSLLLRRRSGIGIGTGAITASVGRSADVGCCRHVGTAIVVIGLCGGDDDGGGGRPVRFISDGLCGAASGIGRLAGGDGGWPAVDVATTAADEAAPFPITLPILVIGKQRRSKKNRPYPNQ